MAEKKRKPVTTTIDEHLLWQFRTLAMHQGRSMNDVLEELMAKYVEVNNATLSAIIVRDGYFARRGEKAPSTILTEGLSEEVENDTNIADKNQPE